MLAGPRRARSPYGSRAPLVAALLLALLLLVLLPAARAGAAPATGWSGTVADVPLHSRAVSCPTATFCVAVGSGGASLYDGTGWSATPQNVDPGATLQSVSCPSNTFCLAVDSAGQALGFDGTSWSAPTAVDGKAPLGGLTSVSCTTGSAQPWFCMAVDASGNALSFTGPTFASGTWTAPARIDIASLAAVSCPSALYCLAADTSGNVLAFDGTSWGATTGLFGTAIEALSCASQSFCAAASNTSVRTLSGGSWGVARPLQPNGGLRSISCPTATFCAAADTLGEAYTFDGTGWSPATALPSGPAGDVTNGHIAVACPSATFCAAVSDQDRAATLTGGTWSGPAVLGSNGLTTVSCATPLLCMEGDGNGRVLTSFAGTAGAPVPVLAPLAGVHGLACPASSSCVAIGGSQAAAYQSGSWGHPQTIDPGATLSALSCPASSWCVATDGSGNVLYFDGSSWSSPEAIDRGTPLQALSCASSSFCVAFAAGNALVYDGLAWSPAALADPAGPVAAVSCPSSAFCMAVGEGEALSFDGTSWTVPQPIDAGGGSTNAVACTSASFCLAAGRADSVTFDGTYWSIHPSVVDPVAGNSLVAASCSSPTSCLAVDTAGSAFAFSGVPPAPTPPPSVPLNTAGPLIAGTPVVGTLLIEDHGTWTGIPTGYGYQWFDCDAGGFACTAIAGATNQTYLVGASDGGHTIRVQETAQNTVGTSGPALSPATGEVPAVAGPAPAPTPTPTPPSHPVAHVAVAGVRVGKPTKGSVKIRVLCGGTAGQTCTVKIRLTVVETLRGRKIVALSAGARPKAKKKTLVLATLTIRVKTGHNKLVTVKLNRQGQRLLSSRRRLRVRVFITQSATRTIRLYNHVLTYTLRKPRRRGR